MLQHVWEAESHFGSLMVMNWRDYSFDKEKTTSDEAI
jgi:hypothetical protein